LQSRKLGKINSSGWNIRYLFGKDDRGDYLDFYATHRMTNDRHVRIYSTGETEYLPAILGMIIYPANASDKEKKEVKEKYLKHCQVVREMLKEKGFFGKIN